MSPKGQFVPLGMRELYVKGCLNRAQRLDFQQANHATQYHLLSTGVSRKKNAYSSFFCPTVVCLIHLPKALDKFGLMT